MNKGSLLCLCWPVSTAVEMGTTMHRQPRQHSNLEAYLKAEPAMAWVGAHLMMLGCKSFLWLTISLSVFLLSPSPTCTGSPGMLSILHSKCCCPDGRLTTRAMYLTATSSFDLMCFMSLISPFRPAPSSPTCGGTGSIRVRPGQTLAGHSTLQAYSSCMGMSCS